MLTISSASFRGLQKDSKHKRDCTTFNQPTVGWSDVHWGYGYGSWIPGLFGYCILGPLFFVWGGIPTHDARQIMLTVKSYSFRSLSRIALPCTTVIIWYTRVMDFFLLSCWRKKPSTCWYGMFIIYVWTGLAGFPEPNAWFEHASLTENEASWWFQIFFIFTPTWGRFPFWLL